MQPFSRETITDRRQPHIRWTAVIAGALVALGSWMLLQLLFTGGALSAIDPDEVDSMRGFGIGTSIGSVLAPLLAMFLGGLVAGRLANHFDRKVSAFHGVLVWTIASVVGLLLLGSALSSLLDRKHVTAHADMAAPPPGASDFIDATVTDINARQKQQNAPTIAKTDLLDAARHAVGGHRVVLTDSAAGAEPVIVEGRGDRAVAAPRVAPGTFDRNVFINRLDEKTSLSRPEAEAVLTGLGDSSDDVMMAASQLALHRERALEAAETSGKALFAAGIGLLLCLVAAAGGGLIGGRMTPRGHRGQGPRNVGPDARDSRTYVGDAGVPERNLAGHTTAPYPTVTRDR